MRASIALLLLALALALATLASGCIRHEFDLCLEDPPHPDCVDGGEPTDAGSDAGVDAATDAAVDAGM